ncbi:MAG: Holliday junction resolvase [Bacteroidetes bacterium]|nr:Holliday junction resolvase [Bacteroidota bacterium]
MANDKFQKWKDLEMDKFRKYTEKKETETASAKLSLWKEEWKSKYEINIRADAISRSNSVILGQISENIAPFFPSFDYNPKDARFLGNPIDMIVFDGLHKNELKNIVFLEIKTGNAKFNKHQRLIREAVISKKVLFREFRI